MLPLARMLLALGVGYREFSEITKSSFVAAASRDYGLRGRPTNTSRVAVMTGLTRKEVKRLKDELARPIKSPSKMGPASMILHFWHKDPDFLSREGDPLDLAKEGAKPSFQALVKEYGGDVPAGAILNELKRTGCVIEVPSGRLRVIDRYFVPVGAEQKFIDAVAFSLENICDTMAKNVASHHSDKVMFERHVWSDRLRETQQRQFEELSVTKARALLEMLDDWLAANEDPSPPTDRDTEPGRIGLGVYYFDTRESK